jgi:hypothetical protein
MATTHDTQDTQNAQDIETAKQEIISELDRLSLAQLRNLRNHIETLQRGGLPKGMSGAEFVEWVSRLRDEIGITDEEFDEFDRILREADEEEKRRLRNLHE